MSGTRMSEKASLEGGGGGREESSVDFSRVLETKRIFTVCRHAPVAQHVKTAS